MVILILTKDILLSGYLKKASCQQSFF